MARPDPDAVKDNLEALLTDAHKTVISYKECLRKRALAAAEASHATPHEAERIRKLFEFYAFRSLLGKAHYHLPNPILPPPTAAALARMQEDNLLEEQSPEEKRHSMKHISLKGMLDESEYEQAMAAARAAAAAASPATGSKRKTSSDEPEPLKRIHADKKKNDDG